jgi:epoxyqueuosine reductase QueG
VEHPILNRIKREGFTSLGWFAPSAEDKVPPATQFVILIGNAGPDMFRRFARERNPATTLLDDWTRDAVTPLAQDLGAEALFPFDKPPHPFLTWARKAGAGHTSPLGLNIHREYGLWHAYRAALLFPVAFDLPRISEGAHPCQSCAGKPCLSACPVNAFDGNSYDVKTCGKQILADAGADCMSGGCKARLACPVGAAYRYAPQQMQFHMGAFQKARSQDI